MMSLFSKELTCIFYYILLKIKNLLKIITKIHFISFNKLFIFLSFEEKTMIILSKTIRN
jgi:hypothetical protein